MTHLPPGAPYPNFPDTAFFVSEGDMTRDYQKLEERPMSSVLWDQDNLIQRVRNHVEELGHVKYDSNSNNYVLWLKDTREVFGTNRGYIRGDSFPSMKQAKQNAAASTSARLFHYMWLVDLRGAENSTGQDIAQGIRDAENGKPLTESTFKYEMEKADKRERLYLVIGIVVGIVIGVIGILV